MSVPDKCPFCGAPLHTVSESGRYREFQCQTSIMTHNGKQTRIKSKTCLKRQRDTLTERVKAAERERDDALAMLGVRVWERDKLKARVKELEAYADRLEQEGHWLAQCVPQNDADRWHKAKETKP